MAITTEPVPPGFMKSNSGKIVPISRPSNAAATKKAKLLVCIQFYEGDRDAAEGLALLIADLERTRCHDADILLVNRADCRPLGPTVKTKLAAKFNKVLEHKCRRTDAKGYPHGPNQMFSDLVMLMGQRPLVEDYYAFVNLETDCVPTRPGWISELAEAWRAAKLTGKSVIGFIHDNPIPHLNGVAVWASEIMAIVGNKYLIGSSPSVAFDIWQAKRIEPHAAATPLIRFSYRKETITPAELFATHPHSPSDKRIKEQQIAPCLYHGVKDDSARAAVRARHITFTDKPAPALPEGVSPIMSGLRVPTLAATESVSEAKKPAAAPAVAQVETVPVEARPTVYTYSQRNHTVGNNDLAAIVAAWTKGWTTRGWNPIVLTFRDAAKHPRFDEFSTAIEKLPTSRDRKRAMHRFYRWLALNSAGGGLLVEYDVVPANFTPAQRSVGEATTLYRATKDSRMVGAFFGKDGSADFVSRIIAYDAQPEDRRDGRSDVNDETILARMAIPEVITAELAHFSSEEVGNERKGVAMERFLAGE